MILCDLDDDEIEDFKDRLETYPEIADYFFDDDVVFGPQEEIDIADFMDATEYMESSYEDDEKAMVAFLEYAGGDQACNFDEAYCGQWGSEEEYATELFDDIYGHEVPDFMQYYINYEAFTRDLFMSDYYYADGYVFRTNW